MLNYIIDYIRSWFPQEELPVTNEFSRKRRGSDTYTPIRSPKHRKVLSAVNNINDGVFSATRRSPNLTSKTRAMDIKAPYKRTENDLNDVSYVRSIKGTSEKRADAKKTGFEFITRFSPNYEPVTVKSPNLKAKAKTPPPKTPTRALTKSAYSTPNLDNSIRLDEKRKYQQLLDHMVAHDSFNTSFYATPLGSWDRSRRLVDLARAKSPRKYEVIDLTESKRLSTKDTVIKILDDFEEETQVIEDSESEIEILPTPPSPKPDVKVSPVNSLKVVVDTSKPAQPKWLDDIIKTHEQYLLDKEKEIQAYQANASSLNEINQDILLRNLSRRVQNSLSLKETILPVIEIDDEIELPKLTSEHLQAVKKAMSGDPNAILAKKFNLNINRRDILTLAGLNWLNDNVINFYMNLIIERGENPKWPKCYAMNTFFYQRLLQSGPDSLKRWTRKVDVFSYEFICVPIHLGMHWCMAIVNLRERSIRYYDSMGKVNNQCLNALKNYLEFEHMDKKKEAFSAKDFLLENVQDIPQQMNGSDCGMFACTFAEFVTRRAKFSFDQEDMPYLRKKMVLEIITGELMIQ